jgi:polar amino acid transport system substrate-binding protein
MTNWRSAPGADGPIGKLGGDINARSVVPVKRPARWSALCTLALAGLLGSVLQPAAAGAETVVERAARTGVITLGGRTDAAPYSFLDDKQEVVGLSIDVANRIAAEVGAYLGRPVKILFQPSTDSAQLFSQVSHGEVDLACGAQFTWEREMFVDFTLPFSLSGIRVLSRNGQLSGSSDSLAGRRIGAIAGSLGEAAVKDVQPKAVAVPVAGIPEGFAALQAGKLDGLAGDSILLATTLRRSGARGFELVPREPFVRYAVGCILPENNSTFANLANLAIAKLLQGYINGNPSASDTVNRWVGPKGLLELPPELIKDYFRTVLLTREQIRVPAEQPLSK